SRKGVKKKILRVLPKQTFSTDTAPNSPIAPSASSNSRSGMSSWCSRSAATASTWTASTPGSATIHPALPADRYSSSTGVRSAAACPRAPRPLRPSPKEEVERKRRRD
ncbi:unnamed protein product, partial [Linum tenue]